MKNRIYDITPGPPAAASLWDGKYKIPWNDPAFSARILKEHLSQEHELASRTSAFIEAQAAWIAARFPRPEPAVLDLGCGPGLYAQLLAGGCDRYIGLDFSPAAIDHARRTVDHLNCGFRLDDVTEAPFDGPYDLVMMLYGEFNVFSPNQARGLLAKAYAAMTPGGLLLIERHRTETVRTMGSAAAVQVDAPSGGLFSDDPYVCLTESFWYEEQGVFLQRFTVREEGREVPTVYRSTTKAWTRAEMAGMLNEAGFVSVTEHPDWPVPDSSLTLVSATKA